jgi:hypothetical protein
MARRRGAPEASRVADLADVQPLPAEVGEYAQQQDHIGRGTGTRLASAGPVHCRGLAERPVMSMPVTDSSPALGFPSLRAGPTLRPRASFDVPQPGQEARGEARRWGPTGQLSAA